MSSGMIILAEIKRRLNAEPGELRRWGKVLLEIVPRACNDMGRCSFEKHLKPGILYESAYHGFKEFLSAALQGSILTDAEVAGKIKVFLSGDPELPGTEVEDLVSTARLGTHLCQSLAQSAVDNETPSTKLFLHNIYERRQQIFYKFWVGCVEKVMKAGSGLGYLDWVDGVFSLVAVQARQDEGMEHRGRLGDMAPPPLPRKKARLK